MIMTEQELRGNLTIQKKIVFPVNTFRFIEGYVIAVFECKGQSRVCRGIFNQKSGQANIARWKQWLLVSNFESFAVSNFTQNRLAFAEMIEHYGQVHEFELSYELDFHVLDAEAVCIHIKQDPLSMLAEEVRRSVGAALAQKEWPRIIGGFRDLAKEILEEQVEYDTRFESLNRYAAELGLKIVGIKLQRRLTDDDIKVDLHRDQAGKNKAEFDIDYDLERHKNTTKVTDEKKDELSQLAHQGHLRLRQLEEEEALADRERMLDFAHHELELKKERDQQNLRLQRMMNEKIIEGIGTAFQTVAQNITSGKELAETLTSVSQAYQYITSGGGTGASLVDKSVHGLPPLPAQMGDKVAQVVLIIDNTFIDDPIKLQLIDKVKKLAVIQEYDDAEEVHVLKKEITKLLNCHQMEFEGQEFKKVTQLLNLNNESQESHFTGGGSHG